MQKLIIYAMQNPMTVVAEITWTPKEGIQVLPHDVDGTRLLKTAVEQIRSHATLPMIMEEMDADNALVMKQMEIAPNDPLYLRALGDMLGINYDYACDWLMDNIILEGDENESR